ncbi:replicative DNA helicase [Thermosporothrix hazakensis]|jgi:replicative DNA helicase|uniref:Replicative DNA helicase n=2 Tax=Thermosporothrix TaxID=768650 RepID=A0A326U6L3_THEHA|nr:replicative DNA helicase [Thermosporothrix hazakensis]PZW29586.1 replicative DNA helicase [Thermosporothrix hazakensis]BBH85870.1 replicative DNA helicase [Thermosporothrix sp. COM3]GCE45703.1 replicative DNA helicase [Thermosporothrix hazakensis]
MERALPHNIEAEAGVLGSLLIDPEAIPLVTGFLQPEHFYRDGHRLIYAAIIRLFERREAADYVTVCHELERENKLEAAGGEGYVIDLIGCVPTSGNVEYYARIVERMAILRRLIHAGGQIVAKAYSENDVDAAIEYAEQLLFDVRQTYTNQKTIKPHISDALVNYMARLEYLTSRREQLVGTPTGFTDLDRLLGGLQPSDLVILAARPAVGKTSFALSLAHNAALKHQRRVGIFSLEMSQEQLVQRLVSMDAGIDQQRLRTGELYDEDWERIVTSMATLSECTILIDDTPALTPLQMQSKARQWFAEYGELDLIIVDYLQLMQLPGNDKRQDNRVQAVDEISRQLKVMARELNVPVLALSQLSRAVETRQSKIPMLSDLRESGGIEQTADVVLFIYRDDVYNPDSERKNLADIIIAKHRNGPTGEVCLFFNRSQTRFQDITPNALAPSAVDPVTSGYHRLQTLQEDDFD